MIQKERIKTFAINTNACPKVLNPIQSFRILFCSILAFSSRSESIFISFSFRANIRITFKLLKLSPMRPKTLSQCLFAIRCVAWAFFPIDTIHQMLNGNRKRLMTVMSGLIQIHIIMRHVAIIIWGITRRRRLSHACQTASAQRSMSFCFSPACTPRW